MPNKKFKKSSIILTFFLLVLVITSCAQSKIEQINQLITTYSNYELFNGSILVAHHGEVIFQKGVGLSNKELTIPNSTNTKHRIASVTKQFTAMLILQLVAEEKLTLHSPITTYLSDYPKKNGDQITLHHLLTHTSGIPNYTDFSNYREMMNQSYTPTQLIQSFADSSLQFNPGEKFQYSNSGYVVLGKIIEKVTNESFENVLQKRIFTPLKMFNSGYENNKKTLSHSAKGYWMNGGSFNNANFIDMSVAFSAGGLYSTVEDLFLWDQALYTEQLLPQKFVDSLFGKYISAWGGHYAYGWNIKDQQLGSSSEKVYSVSHSGVINGFSSLILRIPSSKSTVLLLDNTSSRSLDKIAQAITGILYEQPFEFPKKSVANSLYKVIVDEGIQQGLSYYEKVKSDDNYYRDESEMNLLGYNLLGRKKVEAAVAVLEINAKTYYKSSNAQDSYGEALLTLGDTLKAIEYYGKSLELDPNNKNGLEVLRKLGADTEFYERLKSGLFNVKNAWRKEIFPLPVGFAPKITYKGIEEARFSDGWANKNSEEFWTYLFGWYIETDKALTKEEFEENLQFYFDGLMSLINKDRGELPQKTKTQLISVENNNQRSAYKGDVTFYDAFFTHKVISLKLQVNQRFCQNKNKALIEFRFSPQAFDHNVWSKLQQESAVYGICEK